MTLERSRGEKTAMLGPAQCSVDRTEETEQRKRETCRCKGENNAG
jgi:hypothetical protein